MERSMRPRSRKDNKGMSPKELEDSTSSPDGLTIEERNKREIAAKKAKKPVAMMYGGKMPEKMSYGGKTPKKMGMGGGTGKCRGMGAATRGGNFKMG